MDIHRSRFVPFPASPINTVSFSRSNDKGLSEPKAALKLAIGRANGNIEIWSSSKGDWVQETVFGGGENKSIDALVWIQEPDDTDYEGKPIVGQLRLFSIGSTAAVTEWNLQTGRPLRSSTGNFSEVWCLAAQPRWRANKAAKAVEDEFHGQNLVAGCGDGTLALLSTADDDLVFQRFLARSGSRKTRCMSVTWQGRDRIIAGFSDSSIRVYDARNGALLRNMSLGASLPGAPKDTLVWRIKCLPNLDIVSADSNGEVKFWDGKNYNLTQRLTGHDSDCLEIVVSSDGQTVFSGGMDGRIATYKLGGREGERRRWAKTSHRRVHQGDIKSMAAYDSKAMSVVVSGGFDASPAIIPLRAYNKELHYKITALPQTPPVASAPSQRLLVSWWDREVCIWRVGKQQVDNFSPEEKSRNLVARIALKGAENISSVAISQDGRILAVSSVTSVKVFQLRPSRDAEDDRLRVRTLDIPASLSKMGAKVVQISPDCHWLSAATLENEVVVARLVSFDGESNHIEILDAVSELERQSRKLTQQTGLKHYERTIVRLAFSADSSVLVAGDLSGYLDSWLLQGHFDPTAPAMDKIAHDSPAASRAGSDSDSDSDSSDDDDDEITIFYGQHWVDNAANNMLPRLDSTPLVMSFRPSSTHNAPSTGNPGVHPTRGNPHAHSHAKPTSPADLLVITQHHTIHEFSILHGRLSPWSRRNPSSILPPEIRSIKDRIMGVVWDVSAPGLERVWLYGPTWLGMLDVSQNFDPPSTAAKPVSEDEATEAEGLDDEASGALVTQPAAGTKRKRTDVEKWAMREEKKRRVKGTSGAGDRVHEAEKRGVVSSAREIVDGVETALDLEARTRPRAVDEEDVDEDDDMDIEDGATGPLRRLDNETDEDGDGETAVAKTRRRRKWWCTFKYRPILGMVPIGVQAASSGDEELKPLEVALVERPPWDLEQMKALGL